VPGSTQTTSLRYFHHDQLGSVTAVSNELGAVIERLAYDPWGKRRNINGLSDVTDSLVGLTTDRGFTEHEHLDEMGIIHMNGRIYDPLIGRFMSADPFIQAPSMLQSYNRYAYVMNNPLSLTDPSGYFWDPLRVKDTLRAADTFIRNPSTTNAFNVHRSVPGVTALDNFVVRNPWAFQIGRAAAGFWGGPWAAAGATGYYTYLTTGCESCSVKAFGLSIATSYAFQGAGDVGEASGSYVTHYAAHAAVGCVSSVAGGGQCGAGALSAVAGLAGEQIGGAIGAGTAGRFATSVVAGGIASRLAGGSFMDGAQTAAYGYLFNELLHVGNRREAMLRAGYSDGGNTFDLRGGMEMDSSGCIGTGGGPSICIGPGAIKGVGSALAPNVSAVVSETLAGNGNFLSKFVLTVDELLDAGSRFLGTDGLRQFRIDANSIAGNHAPGVSHGHLEVLKQGLTKPVSNNHIPFN
jgi:RHS repeat-associated protein